MSAEVYEVESILKAKAYKSGRKVAWKYLIKWKGYGDEDNSMEPEACLRGGADDLLARFWERVGLNGRDRTDVNHFPEGTEVFPVGPPRRSKIRPTQAADRVTVPDEEPQLSSSSRRKKRVRESAGTDAPPVRKRPRQKRETISETAVARLLDADTEVKPPESPSVPDSEEETLKLPELPAVAEEMAVDEPAPQETTRSMLPPSPRLNLPIKPMEKSNPTDTVSDPIPANPSVLGESNSKAGSSKPKKRRKPGPGRSSEGFQDPTALVDIKSRKSVRATELPPAASQTVQEVLEVADYLASDGAAIDSVAFNSHNETGAGTSNVEVPVAPLTEQDPPSLLDRTTSVLVSAPESEENGSTSLASATDVADALIPGSSLSSPVIFAPTAPIGTTSSVPSSGSRWGLSSTIFSFGPGARLDNAPNPGNLSSTQVRASNELALSISPNLSIPITLSDQRPAISIADSCLDNLALAIIPGKLYRKDAAMKLLDTLETGGAAAAVSLNHKASPSEVSAYNHLSVQLASGSVYIAVFGNETIALCSSKDTFSSTKLAIPKPLSDLGDTVLASHVKIRDVSAYAEAAVEGESPRL